ncbi:hypothetical protein RclHR1_08760015 [Rhizophagus clarus]|jgi:hypothetical protein|uniref:Probable DNA polymerase n=2 Tax=Rhizophagus TaxID=1129544 RepID=A0A2Z6SP27_9GLOM|nr:DNA polymerase [Rhizophagus sp. (in: glomeromycetes)]BBO53829.1 DNA polymerase B [Rhizophagus clarus]GBC09319.1 hypothetical protein RclHR1_08760015 [Rhizophagus clarus]
MPLKGKGENYPYMASWFNGNRSNTFNLTQYNYNKEQMLQEFWINLIKENPGGYCYFHNFGGYDAILSIGALLNTAYNYEFIPIMKDGEFISIKVMLGGKLKLTIMDSIRILPASLAKLAKDWKVETLKSHFPHYGP